MPVGVSPGPVGVAGPFLGVVTPLLAWMEEVLAWWVVAWWPEDEGDEADDAEDFRPEMSPYFGVVGVVVDPKPAPVVVDPPFKLLFMLLLLLLLLCVEDPLKLGRERDKFLAC